MLWVPGSRVGAWWSWAGVQLSSLIVLSHPNRIETLRPEGPEKATWSI